MSIGGRAGSTGDALPEGTEIAGHRIEAMVHRGDFANYYAARAPAEGTPVLVRELFPGFVHRTAAGEVRCYGSGLADTLRFARRRFSAEGRALQAVDAAALPHVFAVHEANRTAYWVLERSEGERLSDILAREGPATPPTVERVAMRLLDAMERMHEAGTLHLDICPQNVLLDGASVRLVGSAFTRFATQRFNRDVTRRLPHDYAALELHATNEPGDPASDIYGLAATLFHMATGRAPPSAPARAKADGVGAALDGAGARIGRGLARAIEDGLGLLVEDRPQSAAEWRSAFSGIA